VPLTVTRFGPEEMLGGGLAAPAPADAAVIRTLTKAEPIAVPTGRADDFSWPRGMGNVELDAVERAAPDNSVPDAGTKSDKPVQARRRWMPTPLKQAESRSRPSAGRAGNPDT
jgi:hypothetical protein